ncbi:hypothetical protein Lbys_3276 [Leadbetterella byssophila DSM 17132]|uniref:Uncharacterized protein n=1 Tax=Leadbetterella byssophila (strain DSM 17132 / JCM 16389 / KACC 11308 / NBRC 106382 / 4M15) TaxID=649349 RepID=E4RWJ6_LEAB4|nr:hypothetical protein Lbys_3276 [Leadbetterella byssophila DSM 17132]
MKKYYLNLIPQSNGDYEVHSEDCNYRPKLNYDELGYHSSCSLAVTTAKRRHPLKKINGCYYCSKVCHTS